MKKEAVLGFAYGFRKNGLCKSNIALIAALRNKHPKLFQLPLIMQDGLADCLRNGRKYEGNMAYIVRSRTSEKYVDTDTVIQQSIEAAVELGCTTIYILAYPILHRQLCWFMARRLARPYHIQVRVIKTGWIPSDPLSEQWWTRNPFFPFIYTALRVCFNRRGK